MLRALRKDDGLSLIEVLIGMSTGLIVAAAAFAMLEMGMRLYTRTSQQVDAAQTARAAMADIVNALQSSCVSSTMYGVQSSVPANGIPAADANHLVFVTWPDSSVVPVVSSNLTEVPVLHDIVLAGGTLTDYSYDAIGSPPPSVGPWTFPSTASSSKVLANNATQTGSTPVFQYFAYGSDGEIDDGTNGTAAAPLDPGSTLTTTDAQNTAEVVISFTAGPYATNSTINDATTSVTSAVVLRLTPNTTVGTAPPCH